MKWYEVGVCERDEHDEVVDSTANASGEALPLVVAMDSERFGCEQVRLTIGDVEYLLTQDTAHALADSLRDAAELLRMRMDNDDDNREWSGPKG